MIASPDVASAPPASSSEALARSAGLAGSATLVSRILGVARETVQAAYFGAGNEMDAYLVAFRVPTLLRDLFAEGAMSAAFVPTFTRQLTTSGKTSAWRLGNNVITTLLIATGLVVALAWWFADPLVRLYAGDFALIPGKIELTVRLTRIMLPFLTLVALAAAAMGMLNACGHYFMPALAPAAFNVASIGSAILLTPVMIAAGLPPVTAIAIGALIGGVGQVALQWPSLRREGFRYRPTIDLADPGLRQVLLLMGPGTLGLAATQVNLFVSTLLAARQGPGAVSWLQYGFRLLYLPIGLFGVSIATAVLPAVSRHLATDNHAAVNRTVTRGIALMLLVNIPATVGLVVLAEPIVRLLLERGHFTPADTRATAAAVQCYAVGLLGYSAARIASPIFYALKRSRVAVAISTVSVVVNLALSLVFTASFGYRGLALATSLAATVNGGLATALLHRHLRALSVHHLIATATKATIAAAMMAATLYAIVPPVQALIPGTGFISQAIRLLLEIGAGISAFGIVAMFLKIPELETLRNTWLRRQSAELDQ